MNKNHNLIAELALETAQIIESFAGEYADDSKGEPQDPERGVLLHSTAVQLGLGVATIELLTAIAQAVGGHGMSDAYRDQLNKDAAKSRTVQGLKAALEGE